MTPVLTGLIVAGVAAAIWFPIVWLVDQRKLRHHRGVSRQDFIQAFAADSVTQEIPAAVYDYYKQQVVFKEYSVAPDDDYEATLSKGDEDIDDDAAFLMKRLGLKRPSSFSAARAETRIKTLRDMVHWLNWLLQHQGT